MLILCYCQTPIKITLLPRTLHFSYLSLFLSLCVAAFFRFSNKANSHAWVFIKGFHWFCDAFQRFSKVYPSNQKTWCRHKCCLNGLEIPSKFVKSFRKSEKNAIFDIEVECLQFYVLKSHVKSFRWIKTQQQSLFLTQRPHFFSVGFQAADPNPNIVIPPKMKLFPYIPRLCLNNWWTVVA